MPSFTSLPVVAFLATAVLLVALALSQFELYYANVVGRSLIDNTLTHCHAQLSVCQRDAAAKHELVPTVDSQTRSASLASECPNYATPVGTWVAANNREGKADTWVPLDPACRIEDHFTALVQERPTPVDDKAILLIGDSLDKYILRDFCQAAGGAKEPSKYMVKYIEDDPSNKGKCCSYPNDEWTCTKTKLLVGSLWQFGVKFDGPYYVEEQYLKTITKLPTLDRIRSDGPRFGDFVGRQPDQVVYRSLFWDLARMHQKMPEQLSEYWKQESAQPVWNFVHNMTTVMQTIKETFPSASSFIYVTTPCPNEGAGYHFRRYVGKLNVAGRRAAELEGFTVVDLDMMVLEMTVEERTFDGKHPNEDVNRNLINIYLNVLQHTL